MRDLAKRACLHMNSVVYWEGRSGFSPREHAVTRMLDALEAAGVAVCSNPQGVYFTPKPAPETPGGIQQAAA